MVWDGSCMYNMYVYMSVDLATVYLHVEKKQRCVDKGGMSHKLCVFTADES